jgi:hypothetical protein
MKNNTNFSLVLIALPLPYHMLVCTVREVMSLSVYLLCHLHSIVCHRNTYIIGHQAGLNGRLFIDSCQ